MEYIGDEQSPAPLLRDVILAPEEVEPLFELLFENIRIWLACNRVHADLSPYNILYWDGVLKIIDFPQSVDPRVNRNAYTLLQRDIKNICRYWARYGIRRDALELANDLYECWLHRVGIPNPLHDDNSPPNPNATGLSFQRVHRAMFPIGAIFPDIFG